MTTKSFLLSLTWLALAGAALTAAPVGTSFTFQGRLTDNNGTPANGTLSMAFSLWDAASGGNNVGVPTSLARNVQVANGVFTTDLDFGASAFTGDARWLETSVGGTPQSTRTRVAPTPNAIFASTARTAVMVNSASIQASNLNTVGAPPAAGQVLTYNGTSLAWQAPGGGGGVWTQSGTNIFYNSGRVGIGTNQPAAALHVNGPILSGQNNTLVGDFPSVGGGLNNGINGDYSTIAGGAYNTNLSSRATIAGGTNNVIETNARGAFIAAGRDNRILSGAANAVVGGLQNTNASQSAVIAGGALNMIGLGSASSAISGGDSNFIETNAPGSVIAGGFRNRVAPGGGSIIGGGTGNAIGSNSSFAVIPGGHSNFVGGHYGFAAGRHAKARHQGSWVWADSMDAEVASTGNDQFVVRASGGVAIGTNDPAGAALRVAGTVRANSFDGPITATQLTGTLAPTNLASAPIPGQVLGYNGSSMVWQAPGGGGGGVWSQNGTNIFYNSGWVGIGTNQPGAPLHVRGSILSGQNNNLGGNLAAMGGGLNNTITADFAVIGGGNNNVAAGSNSTVAGGATNRIEADYGVISGGESNAILAGALRSTISGGSRNSTAAERSAIAGGSNNIIEASAAASFIAGGVRNRVIGVASFVGGVDNTNSGNNSVIVGGYLNAIKQPGAVATISGGSQNTISEGAFFSTIGGGESNVVGANALRSTVNGGSRNVIGSNALFATIAGGVTNFVGANQAAIAGGTNNVIEAGAQGAFIAGGHRNRVRASGPASFVSGVDNTNEAGNAVIAGGYLNLISTDGAVANIGGGARNTVAANTATIAGGGNNTIQPIATLSVIGGGGFNTIGANAEFATIPGGSNNVANGRFSFAAGHRAKALHQGSFVWGDSTGADIASTGNDQFVVRAAGGMRLNPATSLYFGNQTRQMLNLWGTDYGIGVQGATVYFRTEGGIAGTGFAWYRGGTHNDGIRNPGGGSTIMTLNDSGLTLNVPLNLGTGPALNLNGTLPSAGQVVGYNGSSMVWQDAGMSGSGWGLTGNSVTAGNFLGTINSQPLEVRVNNSRVLRLEPTASTPNVIGGFAGNQASNGVVGAFIGGGGAANLAGLPATNRVLDGFGTLVGGASNTVGSANGDPTDAFYSFLGGGFGNTADGHTSTIGAGAYNRASGPGAAIVGGWRNHAAGAYSLVAGGDGNVIQNGAYQSTIGGGYSNRIQVDAALCTIAGGGLNIITSYAYGASVAGGLENSNGAAFGFIGGGWDNSIEPGAMNSVLAGGYQNRIRSLAELAVVGGGAYNIVDGPSTNLTICGGSKNFAGGYHSSIGGGFSNTNGGNHGTIGGGRDNFIATNINSAVIAGGNGNSIRSGNGVIGGGKGNYIPIGFGSGTIAGGQSNIVDSNGGTIAGGFRNGTYGHYAAVAGGEHNVAFGDYSFLAGGYENWATGEFSFAAGQNATANHNGSFVWSSYPSEAPSFAEARFHVLGYNGFSVDYYDQLEDGTGARWVIVGETTSGKTINTWTGAYLSDGGAWLPSSDRARKENFAPVDGRSILKRVLTLPIQTWNYTNELPSVRHLGPMAQDFHAAFGLNGDDDKHIADVDSGGVALAAIQGLHQILQEQQTALTARETENASLKEKVSALQKRLDAQAQTLSRWESRFTMLEQALTRAPGSAKPASTSSRAEEEDPF